MKHWRMTTACKRVSYDLNKQQTKRLAERVMAQWEGYFPLTTTAMKRPITCEVCKWVDHVGDKGLFVPLHIDLPRHVVVAGRTWEPDNIDQGFFVPVGWKSSKWYQDEILKGNDFPYGRITYAENNFSEGTILALANQGLAT